MRRRFRVVALLAVILPVQVMAATLVKFTAQSDSLVGYLIADFSAGAIVEADLQTLPGPALCVDEPCNFPGARYIDVIGGFDDVVGAPSGVDKILWGITAVDTTGQFTFAGDIPSYLGPCPDNLSTEAALLCATYLEIQVNGLTPFSGTYGFFEDSFELTGLPSSPSGSRRFSGDDGVWVATVVPVPAAAWLFGSAAGGLLCFRRRLASRARPC
jgi:hypothetical protein